MFYCLHNFHWKPSDFLNLDRYEKASVMAAIAVQVERDKENEKKANKASKMRGGARYRRR